ncbi:MAG: IclR family transcriptional regulator, partial [Aggregatilineales bacterium]
VNEGRPYSVTELSEVLDVDKSSVSRLLRTMENYGYIQKMPDAREYGIGKRMYAIGWQLAQPESLRESAKPVLETLAAKTGECAHIGMYSSGKVLVTEDVQPEISLLRVVGGAGRVIHMHNTALGKCLLAYGDFPMPTDLPFFTEKTMTDMTALREHLTTVCEQGYALDDEENESGVRCLAAPIFDERGLAIAAIGISGPTVRMLPERLERLAYLVQRAARQLSRSITS